MDSARIVVASAVTAMKMTDLVSGPARLFRLTCGCTAVLISPGLPRRRLAWSCRRRAEQGGGRLAPGAGAALPPFGALRCGARCLRRHGLAARGRKAGG